MTFFYSPALYFIERNLIQLAMIAAVVIVCVKFLMNKDWEDDFPFSTLNQVINYEILETKELHSMNSNISVEGYTFDQQ